MLPEQASLFKSLDKDWGGVCVKACVVGDSWLFADAVQLVVIVGLDEFSNGAGHLYSGMIGIVLFAASVMTALNKFGCLCWSGSFH